MNLSQIKNRIRCQVRTMLPCCVLVFATLAAVWADGRVSSPDLNLDGVPALSSTASPRMAHPVAERADALRQLQQDESTPPNNLP